MAIDTAERRRSAAGVKRIVARVTPNASKDQEWRQQVGRIYSGILAGEAEADVAVKIRRRRRRVIWRELAETTVPVEIVAEKVKEAREAERSEAVRPPEMFRQRIPPVVEVVRVPRLVLPPDLTPVMETRVQDEEDAILALLLAA